jgi:AcrR family transcriptional regulator
VPQQELPVTERLVSAAFELFERNGFEATTVDDIAQHAGVSRMTFFRRYRSKEDVVFPGHDELLSRIDTRLSEARPHRKGLAVADAARMVLDHYIGEGEPARARYRLTTSVPALRAREVAGIQQYQRLFSRYLTDWMASESDGELRAQILAAAVVAAHNHVLRRWLRRETEAPEQEFDHAMDIALSGFSDSAERGSTVVVFSSSTAAERVVAKLERVLGPGGTKSVL